MEINGNLKQLFDSAGVGWALAPDEHGNDPVPRVEQEIHEVEDVYKSRFHRDMSPPLLEQMRRDSTAMKPLIQSFASPMTAAARTMVYCILVGASIERISYEYQVKARSHLVVEIEFPSGEGATFESDEIWDAEVLRHFGLMKLSGKPIIDGYYAFQEET